MAKEVTCASCSRVLGGRRVYYIVCPRDGEVEMLCRTCRNWSQEIFDPVPRNLDTLYPLPIHSLLN